MVECHARGSVGKADTALQGDMRPGAASSGSFAAAGFWVPVRSLVRVLIRL